MLPVRSDIARRYASLFIIPAKGDSVMEIGTGLLAIGAGLAVGLAAIGTGFAAKPHRLGRSWGDCGETGAHRHDHLADCHPGTMLILGFAVAAMIILVRRARSDSTAEMSLNKILQALEAEAAAGLAEIERAAE